MEALEKAYYEVKFENAFLKSKANAFQTFFNDLMSRAYKEDYMPCRPWGNRGDRKNDGFLKSERCLFQVYAPNEMTEKDAQKKISQDFEGAKSFWSEYFVKWVFVHNTYDGIPPHVQKKVLDLEKDNPGIKLQLWGLEELREIFQRLTQEDLKSWLGHAPNFQAKANMGFEEIRVVLESIALKEPDFNAPVKEVRPQKIEANQLSDRIAVLLKQGITKSYQVKAFYNKWHDPKFGELVSKAFRKKYEELRERMTPNAIFCELQSWAGGTERGTPEHEMAVLTVLAYYFEDCDIFEEPNEEKK